MKAMIFAVFLFPLFVVSLPAQAGVLNTKPTAPLVEEKKNKINLNKADVKALTHSCKGIGKKRAQAIVNYREMHGGFRSVEQLAEVRGIGKQFVKRHLTTLQNVFAVD